MVTFVLFLERSRNDFEDFRLSEDNNNNNNGNEYSSEDEPIIGNVSKKRKLNNEVKVKDVTGILSSDDEKVQSLIFCVILREC